MAKKKIHNENEAGIKNRKAFFNYTVFDKYEAGIALKGSEVKSIRNGKANIAESYVRIKDEEAFLVNMHILPYAYSQETDFNPTRPRKLLLHKAEIIKLLGSTGQKGYTIVPLGVYFKRGKVKVTIALCKGKHHQDKRESLKKKAQQRDVERAMRNR